MPLESIYDSSAWPAAVQSCHSLERMFLSSSSNNFHLLVHIVAKARVCFVKDLEIQLHVKECQEQLQDFDTLARLLKNPEQFPRLASVHVTIEVDEDSSTLRATLTDMLASLKCRRGLSLTCTMLPPDHFNNVAGEA
ncbi:hypothetical protein CERSUDRAFT_113915 [Gelatoporia subvermispora B]|uniref:Uncharacterized protein n=1 Tax=Ceriporiopsis subvermispora (strain B) TaxID=914234 RepID=M2QYM7_CERS8|nr:hypothetical protein CERSUDRAFT_113915 [Gelatoporia subvermispora B]